MSSSEVEGFRDAEVVLRKMDVHLVSIEVSIVRLTVGIVHSECLFFGQHSSDMSHDRAFMKSRLSVD
jgi:hypothetical protein